MDKNTHKKIIVAPLNWGLGHATRCIPIINALLKNNFTPIIASDGKALQFLQQEFPQIESIQLPSYHISYSKNLKWNLLLKVPEILKSIKKEQQIIEQFVTKNNDIFGIISDNRFGVRSKKIPSVYVTHQLNVLSGFATSFTSKIHQNIIAKFDECWVPDSEKSKFSGKLSQIKNKKITLKYIGILSRFKKENLSKKIDILIIISGVEPSRTSFEKRIKKELKNVGGNVVLIQGKIETTQKISEEKNIKIYNFTLSNELQNLINSAKTVICRSGYSSIMDLAVLQKKAFFIPTKHQTEQEYLATYLAKKMLVPTSEEKNFKINLLKKMVDYKGLSSEETVIKPALFRLFERK